MATTNCSIERDETVDAVVMVRAFAIVIEVLLGVVAGIAVLVLALNAGRANKLLSDHHSLAYSIALSSSTASQSFMQSLSMHETASASQLDDAYGRLKFILKEGDQPSTRCISLLSNAPSQPTTDARDASNDPCGPTATHAARETYMEQLHLSFGIPFIVFLVALILALSVLKSFSDRYQGFIPPSTNKTAQQLLFNYLPTTIATCFAAASASFFTGAPLTALPSILDLSDGCPIESARYCI